MLQFCFHTQNTFETSALQVFEIAYPFNLEVFRPECLLDLLVSLGSLGAGGAEVQLVQDAFESELLHDFAAI